MLSLGVFEAKTHGGRGMMLLRQTKVRRLVTGSLPRTLWKCGVARVGSVPGLPLADCRSLHTLLRGPTGISSTESHVKIAQAPQLVSNPFLGSPLHVPLASEGIQKRWESVLRKRKRKMNKHKHRKRLRKRRYKTKHGRGNR